jgi:hypothetical protein
MSQLCKVRSQYEQTACVCTSLYIHILCNLNPSLILCLPFLPCVFFPRFVIPVLSSPILSLASIYCFLARMQTSLIHTSITTVWTAPRLVLQKSRLVNVQQPSYPRASLTFWRRIFFSNFSTSCI